MKPLAWAPALLLLGPVASAQPPEVPPELVSYLNDIETEMGVKRFGGTIMGSLEEEDEATVSVTVSADTDTYIQVVCDDFCEAIYAYAENSAGETIAYEEDDTHEPVLFIGAGNGSQVSVTVTMGYCDEWECQFAIQPFVR
jgi:hypothetical protein